MRDVAVPIGQVVGQLTLRIRLIGARRFRLRFWLAAQMMRLAASIAGTQCEISIGPADEPS